METLQVSSGLVQGVPASIIETALKVFDGADELTDLPVLACVPLVNESDLRKQEPPVGHFEVFREFARKVRRPWLVMRKRNGRVPMV
jgi:hypothetical protein